MRRRVVAAESMHRMRTRKINKNNSSAAQRRSYSGGSSAPPSPDAKGGGEKRRAWIGSTNSTSLSMAVSGGVGAHAGGKSLEERRELLRQRQQQQQQQEGGEEVVGNDGHSSSVSPAKSTSSRTGTHHRSTQRQQQTKKASSSSTTAAASAKDGGPYVPPIPKVLVTIFDIPTEMHQPSDNEEEEEAAEGSDTKDGYAEDGVTPSSHSQHGGGRKRRQPSANAAAKKNAGKSTSSSATAGGGGAEAKSTKKKRTPSPSSLIINSPRSGMVLLKNGVTLRELLPTPLYACLREGAAEHAMPVAMERRFLAKEARRRRLLAKVRDDYAAVCASLSLEGALRAFLDADPSAPKNASVSFAADDDEITDADANGKKKKSSQRVADDGAGGSSSARRDPLTARSTSSRPNTAASHATATSVATTNNQKAPLPMDQSAELLVRQRLERYAAKKARSARQQEIGLMIIRDGIERIKAADDHQKAYAEQLEARRRAEAEERHRRREEREERLEKARRDAAALDALHRSTLKERIDADGAAFERRRQEEARRKALRAEGIKSAIRERQERVAQQERARQFEQLCAADAARRKADKVAAARQLARKLHAELKDERDAMRREEIATQERIAADVLAFRRSNAV